MKRFIIAALAVALGLTALALGGCAPAGDGAEGEDMSGVWGYVAAAKSAQLEVTPEQLGTDTLVVDRVLSPEDAWLVVHLEVDGKPGMRVGLEHVDKGESRNVQIALEDVTTPNVIVAVHADRGGAGTFDFDMDKAMASPDRPFFVDEKELAAVVAISR